MKNVKYYLAAITASTIWGFFSFVLRPLAAWSSVDILFYRVFTSAILLLITSTVLRTAAWKAGRRNYTALSAGDSFVRSRSMPKRALMATLHAKCMGRLPQCVTWLAIAICGKK